MKKKTVITTEKHEIWVVREASSEPSGDPAAVDKAIEIGPSSGSFPDAEDADNQDE